MPRIPGKRARAWSTLAVALLAASQVARADNILRRAGNSTTAAPPVQTADQAAAAAARAAAEARQANSPLRRAMDSIKAFQGAQDAARAAAQSGVADVPNGLGPGGLVFVQDAKAGTSCDGTAPWCGANLPTEGSKDGRTSVTVVQTESKAILTWTSFNVGRLTDLRFDQSAGGDLASTWMVLNRVDDPTGAPSRILGSLKADGHVYVINRNGILFGGSAQVNLATLVASGLDLFGATLKDRNRLFLDPSTGGIGKGQNPDQPPPIFAGDGGGVTVEPGARITVGAYGQALLIGGTAKGASIAPGVVNGGTIEAPDGQVLLAAGDQVSLARATDQRGYAPPQVTGDGQVTNTGVIDVPRGNITMAAAQVDQAGLLTATTAAKASGSIHLGLELSPATVTFEQGSLTQILPDESGGKVVGKTALDSPSTIGAYGEKIFVLGGATLYAPSGNVTLSTSMDGRPLGTPDDTRVYLEAGSRVDVSGLRDVDVTMEQNTVKGELRASELADNPVLRDGPLRGRTVYFDGRRTVTVANLAGYANLVERGVKELMTNGGTVTLASNEVVAREGSVVDLSGGSLRYLGGTVQSSFLITETGQRVRIEDAVAGVKYVGIDGDFVVPHARWNVPETYAGPWRAQPRFETAYEQGGRGGTLDVKTNTPRALLDKLATAGEFLANPAATGAFRVFDGTVVASTVVGPHQLGQPPAGATLVLEQSGDVAIRGHATILPPTFSKDDALPATGIYQYELPSAWFDGKTFTSVDVRSGYWDNGIAGGAGDRNTVPGGHLAIGQGTVVDVGTGGSFKFAGRGVELDGTIRAPGGTVTLQALQLGTVSYLDLAPADRPTIHVGATGTIDVAGRWANRAVDPSGAPYQALDGGSISLTASNVLLDAGSVLDASGGARLDATGAKLTPGKGGSLSIDVRSAYQPGPGSLEPSAFFDGRLVLGGTLRAYGVSASTVDAAAAGGTLAISTAEEIRVVDTVPAGEVPIFSPGSPEGSFSGSLLPSFFQGGGFASYSITGERGIAIASGTRVAPSVQTLIVPQAMMGAPGGGALAGIATPYLLRLPRLDPATGHVEADGPGLPMVLTLSTLSTRPRTQGGLAQVPAPLVIEQGGAISLDPGSTVRLAGNVTVEGLVQAPGGTVEAGGATGSVTLGKEAKIDVRGYQRTSVDGLVFRQGVEPGGSVSLTGGAVTLPPGAEIDASGVSGFGSFQVGGADAGGAKYEDRPVAGAGGSITVKATAAPSLLAGTFRLGPGGDGAMGGSLKIDAGSASGMVIAQSPTAPSPGAVTVSADSVNGSGADDVELRGFVASSPSPNLILFSGDVSLSSHRTLRVLAPYLGTLPSAPGDVTLASGYVQLGGVTSTNAPGAHAASVAGTLKVKAGLIDVSGAVSIGNENSGGFQTTILDATGDIRLSDHDARGIFSASPGLFTDGALVLDAAQVYVATRLQNAVALERADADPGFLVRSNISITVKGKPGPTTFPLSFGERMTLQAPMIEQGGVLRAPQGQIRLEAKGPDGVASGTVTLLPGSVTSVSLDGQVAPFGPVLADGSFRGYDTAGQAPSKSVRIDAANVAVQAGATVDASGGGEVAGYAFIPGNGGSADVLSAKNTYAILPWLGVGTAPLAGASSLQDPNLQVGAVVWLEGVPGLAAGAYTLLPAHYGLLPGALVVQPLDGKMQGRLGALPQVTTRPDGSFVVAGYRGVEAADGTVVRAPGYPGWGQFRVMTRDVFGRYSEITTYSFTEYAHGLAQEAGVAVRTPNDAGTLTLNASQSLALDGSGRFTPGEGGLLGLIDVSAARIALLGPGGTAPDSSYLSLDAQRVADFGAGSVLLGGTRGQSSDGTGTSVSVTSTDILVGAGASWSGPELLLAARQSVSIADGAVLRARGAASGDTSPLFLAGDGALLRLSTGSRVEVSRTGSAASTGELAIGNATLEAAGSLTLEASRSVALAPSAIVAGTQIDLASTRVAMGDVPAGTGGTVLGNGTLAQLGAASDLLVRGRDAIEIHGAAVVGNRDGSGAPSIKKLTLDTGLLQGVGTGTAEITVGELALQNSGGGAAASGSAGALGIDVGLLTLGPGEVRVAGYGSVGGQAGVLQARGTGSLALPGSFSVAAGSVSAASGARYAVTAGGNLTLASGASGSAATVPEGLGARLSLSGTSVTLDTSVLLPAGTLEATASSGMLLVGPHAVLDVSGRVVDFQGQARYAPGGAIRLAARGPAGSIAVDGAAVLDVSGAAGGGDAGGIELAADGAAAVHGTLRGTAAAGFRSADFSLDARSLDGFSALDAGLEANGFGGSREFRLRAQDLALGAGETITAHEVVLRSDSGTVSVAGRIDASGTGSAPDGGRIRLLGGNGVSVTGQLDAHAGQAAAGGFDPSSGTVEIAAAGGQVDVAPGSTIDVSGGSRADGTVLAGGTLVARAPRTGSGDVAVARLGGTIRGAREVDVQGVQSYQASAVDAALVGDATRKGTLLGDAAAWLQGAPAIHDRLAGGDATLAAVLHVGAGMAVSSDGDLVVTSDVPLNGTVGPGHLGLAAGRDLVVGSALSDGFDSASRQTGSLLASGSSSSYSLEAGRDVVLLPGALVRTGTGGISVEAGRDIVLRDPKGTGEAVPPPVIYTAGRRTDPAAGFLGVPAGSTLGEFPVDGGDVTLRAGGKIVAPIARQSTSAWLFRYGSTKWGDAASSTPGSTSTATTTQQTSWSVVFPNFEQGVGALGGGDVEVRAAGDVVQLQVSIPTTGHTTTAPGQVPTDADLVVRGGGNLRLGAGGDLQGGLFMLGRGHADIRAGGSVTTSVAGPAPLFGLMDATASVVAGSGIDIAAAYDPMRQAEIGQNLLAGNGSAWWGYTERAALSATALSGDLTYRNDPLASVRLTDTLNGADPRYQVRMEGNDADQKSLRVMFFRAPGTLRLAAIGGGLTVGNPPPAPVGSLYLGPTGAGNLEFVASGNVRLPLVRLQMEDVAPDYRRGPLAPFSVLGGNGAAVTGVWLPAAGAEASTNSLRGFTPTHAGDAVPARIYSGAGSVCAYQNGSCIPSLKSQPTAELDFPKPLEVSAGKDVVAGNYQPQNNGSTDLTWFRAGRDLFDVALQLSGPGTGVLEAGRDVVDHLYSAANADRPFGGLGYVKGNGTGAKGTQPNLALPRNEAASVLVIAGTNGGLDLEKSAAAYLDPANGQEVVKTYLPELQGYMSGLGYGPMSDAERVTAFAALPRMRRLFFLVDQVYFPELRQTGIDYNDPDSPRYQSYDRGFRAVSLLFPKDPASTAAGDVILSAKPLETWSQGSIDVVAPHGGVSVGSAAFDTSRSLIGGIVTRRGGDIRVMADGNIDLYTSRVFTLQGGSITMWTSAGSITAGSGSKTSVADVPLSYAMSNDGIVTVNVFGLQTGAGIGVLDALQGADSNRPRSRIDLIAPFGEVNAGDAGIRVVGDLNIAALAVVGLENIQVTGGTARGVPQVEVPNVALTTTADALTATATQAGVGPSPEAAQRALAELPSIITVEVVGYETRKPKPGDDPASSP